MKNLRNGLFEAIGFVVLAGSLWASTAHAQDYPVTVTNLGFDPVDVTMVAGETAVWTNAEGTHNVVADDGSFASGPPSSDQWQFSHTFFEGGVYAYHCEEHPTTEMGTITVTGLFGDHFESGTTAAWDGAGPGLPNCNCYFSGDCVAPNGFCDWGDLTSEDICLWRENKPNGVPGAGCDVAYSGPWIAGICDGTCSPSTAGSQLGSESRSLIEAGIQLWAEALLRPAESGGGPVDAGLAEKALELEFQSSEASMSLGRQVADLLVVAGVAGFGDHFCHFEGHPGDEDPSLYVNLVADPCRQRAARTAVAALLAELKVPGSSTKMIAEIEGYCCDWRRMFGPRCTGSSALTCVEKRIADLAVFLTTPRTQGASVPAILGMPEWLRHP